LHLRFYLNSLIE